MVIINKQESQFMLARMPAKGLQKVKICLIATAGILASIN